MSSFQEHITISAPIDTVWQALGDIGSVDIWSPGVKSASVISEHAAGVGAARRCELGDRGYVEEQVAVWDPPHRLTMRVSDSTMPFRSSDVHFELESSGGATQVTVRPEYRLKYGPVGALLDVVAVRRVYRRGMSALLAGLKAHVEDATSSEAA